MTAEQEANRIRDEYQRRARELAPDFYALFHRSNLFAHHTRERELREALSDHSFLPLTGRSLLEVGCGEGEWFATFERFGLDLSALAGIDLDDGRLVQARERAPHADLKAGDATQLPWAAATFDLVFQSTVFSSVLDAQVRSALAAEMLRVLKPGGALIWYDFAFNNPKNSNVKGMKRAELSRLFPHCRIDARKVTLAPPIARRLVPFSWGASALLQATRLLNTHLLAIIRPT